MSAHMLSPLKISISSIQREDKSLNLYHLRILHLSAAFVCCTIITLIRFCFAVLSLSRDGMYSSRYQQCLSHDASEVSLGYYCCSFFCFCPYLYFASTAVESLSIAGSSELGRPRRTWYLWLYFWSTQWQNRSTHTHLNFTKPRCGDNSCISCM